MTVCIVWYRSRPDLSLFDDAEAEIKQLIRRNHYRQFLYNSNEALEADRLNEWTNQFSLLETSPLQSIVLETLADRVPFGSGSIQNDHERADDTDIELDILSSHSSPS